jgi:hypothetical protein
MGCAEQSKAEHATLEGWIRAVKQSTQHWGGGAKLAEQPGQKDG